MDHSDEFKKGWLRGIFDGEGTIFFRGSGTRKRHAMHHISMANTDMVIINTCLEYLKHFGIHCVLSSRKKMSKPHWKQVHNVMIYRQKDILKFADLIGFFCPLKVEKLSNAVEWINRSRTKYDLDELKRMYWDEGLSFSQIATRLGLKARGGVKALFDRWEIPRRDRVSAIIQFNKSRSNK